MTEVVIPEDPVRAPLAGLTAATIGEALERAVAPFFKNGQKARELAIFGRGALGRIVAEIAERAGISVVAFADNNPATWSEGTRTEPPVMSPQATLERFGSDVLFVVAVFNASKPAIQLEALGATRTASYPALCWA